MQTKVIDETQLVPFTRCLICDGTSDMVHGNSRIAAQAQRGITVLEEPDPRKGKDILYCGSRQVQQLPPVFVTLWGDSDIWNESLLDRAAQQVMAGFRPWYCQLCGDRACPVCRVPYQLSEDSDCVLDSGEVGYQIFMAQRVPCLNRCCLAYRPPSYGKWSVR